MYEVSGQPWTHSSVPRGSPAGLVSRWAIMSDATLPAGACEMVLVSGAAEIAGGLALVHPRTRRAGGWWLIATLLGVFPANVHMALHPEQFPGIPGGKAALWARLPVQGAFIALVRAAMRAR